MTSIMSAAAMSRTPKAAKAHGVTDRSSDKKWQAHNGATRHRARIMVASTVLKPENVYVAFLSSCRGNYRAASLAWVAMPFTAPYLGKHGMKSNHMTLAMHNASNAQEGYSTFHLNHIFNTPVPNKTSMPCAQNKLTRHSSSNTTANGLDLFQISDRTRLSNMCSNANAHEEFASNCGQTLMRESSSRLSHIASSK